MKLRPAWHVSKKSATMSALFAIVLCLSIGGLWVLANVMLPRTPSPPEDDLNLGLHIIGSGWELSYNTNQSRSNTAFLLLLEGARSQHIQVTWENWTLPSDAVFVVSIGEDANGEGGRWWQYWVNGKYGEVGASQAKLNDGDLVEWRFVPFPP